MAGDKINLDTNNRIILGPGLHRENSDILVSQNGILRHNKPYTYYVDYIQRRYIPTRGDLVIGVVMARVGDNYKVDIGAHDFAQLSYLAFEGATKKNPPKVEIGDVVSGKLLTANKDMDSEMVCVDSRGKEFIMGVLKSDGYLIHCSINLCRKILNRKCPLIELIYKQANIKMELCVGLNGKIWVCCENFNNTVLIANIILACELLSYEDIVSLCKEQFTKLS